MKIKVRCEKNYIFTPDSGTHDGICLFCIPPPNPKPLGVTKRNLALKVWNLCSSQQNKISYSPPAPMCKTWSRSGWRGGLWWIINKQTNKQKTGESKSGITLIWARSQSVARGAHHSAAQEERRATPISTAAPGSVSLADVSWLPRLSALSLSLSAAPDTAPWKNAALCAAKDRNQPIQRIHRQKHQEGEYRHPPTLCVSSFSLHISRCGVCSSAASPVESCSGCFKLQCPWKVDPGRRF